MDSTETTYRNILQPAVGGALLFDRRIVRRALQVTADLEVTEPARRLRDLAEVQRHGGRMDRAARLRAYGAWTAWSEGHRRLMQQWAMYRRRVPDDGFRPVFQRPAEADILDSLGLPEIKDDVTAWARSTDGAIIRAAGYSDGQRVLPAFVAPWGYSVLAWCGHRWNEHGNAEGPRTPHCPICLVSDEAPFASGYYLVPVDDPKMWQQAYRAFRHRNNVVPRGYEGYSVPLGRLRTWRAQQAAMSARGFGARRANSPRLPESEAG